MIIGKYQLFKSLAVSIKKLLTLEKFGKKKDKHKFRQKIFIKKKHKEKTGSFNKIIK